MIPHVATTPTDGPDLPPNWFPLNARYESPRPATWYTNARHAAVAPGPLPKEIYTPQQLLDAATRATDLGRAERADLIRHLGATVDVVHAILEALRKLGIISPPSSIAAGWTCATLVDQPTALAAVRTNTPVEHHATTAALTKPAGPAATNVPAPWQNRPALGALRPDDRWHLAGIIDAALPGGAECVAAAVLAAGYRRA